MGKRWEFVEHGKSQHICYRIAIELECVPSFISVVIVSHQNEWKHSSSTLSLEEASDLQAIFNNAMKARLHSTEGRLELE